MLNPTIEIITADIKFPSPFTHRVQILCHEKNIPYQLIPINIYQKPAWFLAIAPLGQVPVMRVENTVITDSHAICEYLDSLSAPHLLPLEPLERAQHQALISLADEFAKEITQFIKQKKEKIVDLNRLSQLLEIANNQFKGPYFMGEKFSLVDIAFVSHLLWLDALEARVLSFSILQKYQKLAAWLARMGERDSLQQTTGIDFKTHFIAQLREKDLLSNLG